MSSPGEFKLDFDLKLNFHIILVPFNLIKAIPKLKCVCVYKTLWEKNSYERYKLYKKRN